jgi:hypothetical protein
MVCKWICPGTTSLKLLMTPIKGLSQSPEEQPTARNNDLCGALSMPFFTISLFTITPYLGQRIVLSLKQEAKYAGEDSIIRN